jgi:hypothetical protein
MTAAAAEVVARRTQRMTVVGPNPSARDRREFALMGAEKIDAAAQSALSVGAELWRMNQRLAIDAWFGALAASTDMLSLASSRTAPQALARQKKLARTLRRAAPTAAQLSAAMASLTGATLKPVHARVKRNAGRLRRG